MQEETCSFTCQRSWHLEDRKAMKHDNCTGRVQYCFTKNFQCRLRLHSTAFVAAYSPCGENVYPCLAWGTKLTCHIPHGENVYPCILHEAQNWHVIFNMGTAFTRVYCLGHKTDMSHLTWGERLPVCLAWGTKLTCHIPHGENVYPRILHGAQNWHVTFHMRRTFIRASCMGHKTDMSHSTWEERLPVCLAWGIKLTCHIPHGKNVYPCVLHGA